MYKSRDELLSHIENERVRHIELIRRNSRIGRVVLRESYIKFSFDYREYVESKSLFLGLLRSGVGASLEEYRRNCKILCDVHYLPMIRLGGFEKQYNKRDVKYNTLYNITADLHGKFLLDDKGFDRVMGKNRGRLELVDEEDIVSLVRFDDFWYSCYRDFFQFEEMRCYNKVDLMPYEEKWVDGAVVVPAKDETVQQRLRRLRDLIMKRNVSSWSRDDYAVVLLFEYFAEDVRSNPKQRLDCLTRAGAIFGIDKPEVDMSRGDRDVDILALIGKKADSVLISLTRGTSKRVSEKDVSAELTEVLEVSDVE